jgi:4-hydroxythreonine-4-phosphate dehydrogenase
LSAATKATTRIAALLGDPSGIGPEVMVRLLAARGQFSDTALVLIGDPQALASGEKFTNLKLPMRTLAALGEPLTAGEIGFFPIPMLAPNSLQIGISNAASGALTLAALDCATDAARAGHVQGICFAPMNKHSLRLGGMQAEDEMRHIQARLAVTDFVCEFNVTQNLWTSRVTSHIPLRDVAQHLSHDGIISAVKIIDKSLRAAGLPAPRIGVCGLNPHAGDGGSIGREEIDLIAPAVVAAKRFGIDVSGPYPADTIFVAAQKGAFDGIVTMYHDQGQIAMKLMGFETGITVLGGLPVPFTTCASGSAFDIAGKGIAQIGGLQAAMKTCITMAQANAHG